MMRPWLLTATAALLACGPARIVLDPDERPHMGGAWYTHRAQSLGTTAAQARARDATLAPAPDKVPPELDEVAAREGAALWRQLCADCHGADGEPPPVPEGQIAPRAWGGMGPAMGFAFGGDKMRRGVFKSIAEGKGDAMPAWGGQLANEQIWALVRHIESL